MSVAFFVPALRWAFHHPAGVGEIAEIPAGCFFFLHKSFFKVT